MNKVVSFLSREILWGRLAGVALLTTALGGVTFSAARSQDSQLLTMLALVIFAVGGIVVGNTASRHPFWNALAYSVLCIVFAAGGIVLYRLGTEGMLPSAQDVLVAMISLALFIFPQILAGAWIAVSFRRVREFGMRAAKEKKRTGKEKEDGTKRAGAPRRSGEGSRPEEKG